jgi:hypothetical protein
MTPYFNEDKSYFSKLGWWSISVNIVGTPVERNRDFYNKHTCSLSFCQKFSPVIVLAFSCSIAFRVASASNFSEGKVILEPAIVETTRLPTHPNTWYNGRGQTSESFCRRKNQISIWSWESGYSRQFGRTTHIKTGFHSVTGKICRIHQAETGQSGALW